MEHRPFSDSWKYWIWSNVHQGSSKDDIFGILLQQGYDFEDIVDELGHRPEVDLEDLLKVPVPQGTVSESRYEPRKNAILKANFAVPAKRIEDKNAEIYTVSNFMSKKECQKMVDIICSQLSPSELTTDEIDKHFRTSRTCYMTHLDNEFVKKIDKRICDAIGIKAECSEEIQGQHYEIGQEFKAHTDFFEPDSDEFEKHAKKKGQRTWTFMVYLNDVEEGGETKFVALHKKFRPKTGKAIIWNNLLPDGSPNHKTTHHALPIKKGTKTVITKWFRESSE